MTQKITTTAKWHSVSKDMQSRAEGWGHQVKTSGEFPFQVHEVLATDEEIEHMYDWLTAMFEHVSCPTI